MKRKAPSDASPPPSWESISTDPAPFLLHDNQSLPVRFFYPSVLSDDPYRVVLDGNGLVCVSTGRLLFLSITSLFGDTLQGLWPLDLKPVEILEMSRHRVLLTFWDQCHVAVYRLNEPRAEVEYYHFCEGKVKKLSRLVECKSTDYSQGSFLTHPQADWALFIDKSSLKDQMWVWKAGDPASVLCHLPFPPGFSMIQEHLYVLHVEFLSPTRIWIQVRPRGVFPLQVGGELDLSRGHRAYTADLPSPFSDIKIVWDVLPEQEEEGKLCFLAMDENHLFDPKDRTLTCYQRNSAVFYRQSFYASRPKAGCKVLLDGVWYVNFCLGSPCTETQCHATIEWSKWLSWENNRRSLDPTTQGWGTVSERSSSVIEEWSFPKERGWVLDERLTHPWTRIQEWLVQVTELPVVLAKLVLGFYDE